MNEYTEHIANSLHKTNVVATEDILSNKGVLLAKGGMELNKKMFEKILNFKLLKTIDETISLDKQLTAKVVYNHIIQLVTQDPWLKTINEKFGEKIVLQRCCLRLDKYSLLLQKLTILDIEMNDVFKQSLLSAYLSYICALNKKSNQTKIEEYFLAGISHDIGFLHIGKEILDKKGALEADEWKKIQSHPIIAYEILKRISDFPKSVCQAVLEHHENLDGSGYPRSKTAHDLSSLGQLISLLDNVISIYNKKCKPLNRSLRAVMPAIQINMHSYFPDAVSAIIHILKQVPESPIENSETAIIKELINHVEKEQTYINTIINCIKKANDELGSQHDNKEFHTIQTIANNILSIINSAGLTDTNYTSWLQELERADQQQLYNEVEETRLMLEEIIFQLQSYQKAANLLVTSNPDQKLTSKLNKSVEVFEKVERPLAPHILRNYWDTLAQQALEA